MSGADAPGRPEIDPDDPRPLRTEADGEAPLSRDEAAAAGILPGRVVYGEASLDADGDDKRDSERAAPDEHV